MTKAPLCVVAMSLVLASAAAAQGPPRYLPGEPAMAAYDLKKPLIVRGYVEAVDWSGSTTLIEVRQEDQAMALWTLEAATPLILKAGGFGQNLIPGSRVVVTAYAARNGERRAAVNRLSAYKPEPLGLEGDLGRISDDNLARFAARPWSKGFWAGREVRLGLHHGAELIAQHPCDHLCPPYTIRVIRYVAEPGRACDRIGGVVQHLETQFGSLDKTPYCVPKVLVERRLQRDRRVGSPDGAFEADHP